MVIGKRAKCTASNKPSWADNDEFSTGQVARIMACSPRAVAKAVDGGRLKGGRLLGNADRRVYRASVVQMLRQKGMAHPWIRETQTTDVLYVGLNEAVSEALEKAFPGRVQVAETELIAGHRIQGSIPRLVMMDLGSVMNLRRSCEDIHLLIPNATQVVALVSSDSVERWRRCELLAGVVDVELGGAAAVVREAKRILKGTK